MKIVDDITLIFSARARYFRRVLDGRYSMSRKKPGLQRETQAHPIYSICKNHQQLCLSYPMKNLDFAGYL